MASAPERGESALKRGPCLGGEGVAKDDRVELPMAPGEAGLPSDPLDHPGREQSDELLEVVVGLGTVGGRGATVLPASLPVVWETPSR